MPACALPLTRWLPSSSMGLYDAAFLHAHAPDVLGLKNVRNASGARWKQRGVASRSNCLLGGARARLLCLLSARLAALGGSALPE